MGFKCGIVGLPNVGKSTLFNALTNAGIEASNYPFCTIEPNIGIVPIPDERLDKIAKIVNPKQVLPTTMNFFDIAGLVAGASKGEGLGNKFLANIRETQAIAHVVRCFESEDVSHVTGKIDPIADILTVNTELALADLETVEKSLHKANKNAKGGDKQAIAEAKVFARIKEHLDKGEQVRSLSLDKNEKEILYPLHLLTQKPTLYIANVNEYALSDNPLLETVEAFAKKEGSVVVPICASIEAEIAELDDKDKLDFLKDMGLEEAGLNRVIRAGHKLLELQTYFTAGEKEVRGWTFPIGATAPQAAAVIHTDFEKGFIKAEVISYEDFIKHQGEHGAKDAGKLRIEGKDYIVQDGDVMHFRFNV